MSKRNKSRVTAGILGIFLGWIGVQRFYLGSWLGIIFIMMFIYSPRMAAIAGLIDGIFFLLMSDEQFHHNFNKGRSDERKTMQKRGRQRQSSSSNNERHIRQQRQRKMNRPKKNPYKLSGIRKLAEYDLTGAIEDFQQGLKLDEEDKDIHYNLAKAYSLNEQKDLGFKHLSLAVAYGFSDIDGLSKDEGLAYLRIQPEYEAFKENGFRSPSLEAPERKQGDLLMQLNKLKELRDKGLISEKEYAYEKSKLER